MTERGGSVTQGSKPYSTPPHRTTPHDSVPYQTEPDHKLGTISDKPRSTQSIQDELAATIERAKLAHDPMALLLEHQMAILDRMEHLVANGAVTQSDITRLSNAAARGAERRAAALANAHSRRFYGWLLAAAVIYGVLVGIGSYWAAGGFSVVCATQGEWTVCGHWTRILK